MRIKFTKMQGAGNDFVVLDETRAPLNLTAEHYRFLADRHFGVGADQILSVLPSPAAGVDFQYKIHNADGGEVQQCGNGARCFLSFVRRHQLTAKTAVKVQTMNRLLELQWQPDGQVTVDMEAPVFALAKIPFVPPGLSGLGGNSGDGADDDANDPANGTLQVWPLVLEAGEADRTGDTITSVAVVSMGNPHAVLEVEDVDTALVEELGPRVQRHSAFPEGVNVGFMQVLGRSHIRLRVYERGVGETLACGTGACAAVVCGIRLGLLSDTVDVQTRGGLLTIQWPGGDAPVLMTGPANTVFEGEIDLPDSF